MDTLIRDTFLCKGDTILNKAIFDTTKLCQNICDSLNNIVEESSQVISNNINYSTTSTLWEHIGISTITSITIFILGFILNGLIHSRRKSKELEQYKETIIIWWEKATENISKYINSLEEISTNIKDNDDFNVAKWEVPTIHLTKLISIPIEKATSLFVLNLKNKNKEIKSKNLVNLFNSIEFLDKAYNESRNVYANYLNDSNKIRDEFNKLYLSLYNLVSSSEINDQSTDKFFFEIKNALIQLLKNSQNNKTQLKPNSFKSELIDKIIRYFSENMMYLQDSKDANEAKIIILNIDILINQHSKINMGFSNLFEKSRINTSFSKNEIDKAIEFLKNNKIKRFV